MNLWIRSQQKEMLFKVNNNLILRHGSDIYFIECDGQKIAMYKTRERALEVLDEIQDFITLNCSFEGSLEYLDVRIKQTILSNITRIYEMPKE